MKLDLRDVLGWDYGDIEKLEEVIDHIEVVTEKGHHEICFEIRDRIDELGLSVEDINAWILAAYDVLIYAVEQRLRDDCLGEMADELESAYNPYINYLDSWSGTPLDDIVDWSSWDSVLFGLKEYYRPCAECGAVYSEHICPRGGWLCDDCKENFEDELS